MYQSVKLLRSEPRGGLGWGLTLSRFFHTDSQPYAAHAARCVPATASKGRPLTLRARPGDGGPAQGSEPRKPRLWEREGLPVLATPRASRGCFSPRAAPHLSPLIFHPCPVTGESEEAAAFVPLGKMCLGETSVRPSEEERMQLMSRPRAASYHCRNASFHVRDKGERGIQRASEVPGSR